MVSFGEGSDAWSDNGLAVERGDSLGLIRAEVLSGGRGVSGSLGDGARRLWDVAAQLWRGPSQVRVAYRQNGASGHLPVAFGESAEGENGGLAYRWERRGRWAEARVARGDDHRESAGDTLPWKLA